jgi:glucans biosynthesis protein C
MNSPVSFALESTAERLHGLDALRGFALLLGVAFHACMSYLPGAQYFWIVNDQSHSTALAGWFYWIHLFRMLTFFLIAGFFGRMLLERRSLRAFVRDRFKRIVLPLLTAWPLVFSGIIAVVVWVALIQFHGTLPKDSPPGPKFTPDDFPLTHLWFLYVLSLFYTAMIVAREFIHRTDKHARLVAIADVVMRQLVNPGALLLLAAPLTIALATTKKWVMWFGIPTPDQSLYPNIPALIGFGGAFIFGWLLQRQSVLLKTMEWHRYWHLACAIIATIACLWMVGIAPSSTLASSEAKTWIYAFSYSAAAWSWCFALIGLALRFGASFSATRRYIADASYWIYLIHLPIVMALQVAASLINWPWWIEYPLVLAIAYAILFGSYALFVRHTFIGASLNGRRMPKRLAASPSQIAAQ